MADPNKKLAENVEGDFFVDSTCENWDTCRQLAPGVFGELNNKAAVIKQPESPEERRQALWAVLSCPVGAIGVKDRGAIKEVLNDFPIELDESLYYCGFNTLKAAGGNSYFLRHDDGNWLICTPKYLPHIAGQLEKLGGVKFLFMSHRDDRGDAYKFAEHFGAKRIIHKADIEACPESEIVLRSDKPIPIYPDFTVIPTPGHTEGHCMLLFKDQYLFTGDSLYYDRNSSRLQIWSPLWTWYSYTLQVQSMKALKNFKFKWILPTHGTRLKEAPEVIQSMLDDAIARAELESEQESMEMVGNLLYYAAELRQLEQPLYAAKMEEKAAAIKAKLTHPVTQGENQ